MDLFSPIDLHFIQHLVVFMIIMCFKNALNEVFQIATNVSFDKNSLLALSWHWNPRSMETSMLHRAVSEELDSHSSARTDDRLLGWTKIAVSDSNHSIGNL